MSEESNIKLRWENVKEDVARCCEVCGRSPDDVKIIAVSKTVGVDVISKAIKCGITDFGENRDIPFVEKFEAYPKSNWHFIGNLQSRKVPQVVGRACLIHSVDRPSLVGAIQKSAEKLRIVQDILIEVNISGEQNKAGVNPHQLDGLIEQILECKNIHCKGLMTMAPRNDMDAAEKVFNKLRSIAKICSNKYAKNDNIVFKELSMGMSQDYRIAIAQGATIIRIGRKIFSENFL